MREADTLIRQQGWSRGAILFLDDKTLAFAARDQEFAVALVDEKRDDRGVLLHVDEHADRLAMTAATQPSIEEIALGALPGLAPRAARGRRP